MGNTFWTTCQTCHKKAPELGDCGFIGSPSLSTEPRDGDDELQPFGYIYDGFLAVGIDPLDLHQFHTFLKDHDGHRLRVLSDQDPKGYGEEESDAPEDSNEPSFEEFPVPPGFSTLFYEAECRTCHESVRTETEACLRGRPDLKLNRERIALFLRRVRDTLDVS